MFLQLQKSLLKIAFPLNPLSMDVWTVSGSERTRLLLELIGESLAMKSIARIIIKGYPVSNVRSNKSSRASLASAEANAFN